MRKGTPLLPLVLLLLSCDSGDLVPPTPPGTAFAVGDPVYGDVGTPVAGVVTVCAFYDPGFGGSNYSVHATGGTAIGSFSIDPTPDCYEAWNASSSNDETVTTTILSLPTSGALQVERIVTLVDSVPTITEYFDVNSADVVVNDSVGAIVWFKFESQSHLFPASPPALLPNPYFVDSDPHLGMSLSRLWVGFLPGLTPAEKEAALSPLGPFQVVGGFPSSAADGYYYVSFTPAETLAELYALQQAVKADPRVYDVGALLPTSGAGLAPDDGPAWSGWSFEPDQSLSAPRWALEQVMAPLAWGCETGATTPELIAVLDYGFQDHEDLAANLVYRTPQVSEGSHGTAVASIIAARGNNGQGMTGMMWRASLEAYDVAPVPGEGPAWEVSFQRLETVLSAAQVINLSISFPDRPEGLSIEVYENWRAQYEESLFKVLRSVPESELPLLVVAAGNEGGDSRVNVYPLAVDSFPDRVIVVAGTERDPFDSSGEVGLAFGSNHGPLVSIAAPGAGVFALDSTQTPSSRYGTSFAAPLVTGAAGLVRSAVPHATAPELRRAVLNGAMNGGRSVRGHGFPVLNVYEALKAAAEEPGGNTCGAGIVAIGDDVLVQRANGWETIASVGFTIENLEAVHGGRVLLTGSSGTQHSVLALDQSGWATGPMMSAQDTFDLNGATLSRDGWNHLKSQRASVVPYSYPVDEWEVHIYDAQGTHLAEHRVPSPTLDHYVPPTIPVAWSSATDSVLFSITRYPPSESSTLVWVDVGTGGSRVLGEVPNQVHQLAVSEDGTRVLIFSLDLQASDGCTYQVRDARSFALISSVLGPPSTCHSGAGLIAFG